MILTYIGKWGYEHEYVILKQLVPVTCMEQGHHLRLFLMDYTIINNEQKIFRHRIVVSVLHAYDSMWGIF